jgi:mono/diheme cytochrome c family protein
MKTGIFLSATAMVLAVTIAAAQAPESTLAAAARTQAQGQATPDPAGDADTGEELYTDIGCYACHGFEGQGGVTGPRIAPRPFPLALFIRFVRQPPNQMPLYTDRVVSDEDLGHIHAYLLSRPEPPAVESIPLLQN